MKLEEWNEEGEEEDARWDEEQMGEVVFIERE